jgi:DNA-binding FadR family transcriptional regulator
MHPEKTEKSGGILRHMQAVTDLHAFAELDVKFHGAVIVASGNRLFDLVFHALNGPIHTLLETSLHFSKGQSREETLQHHSAIFEAIQSRDAQKAANAVRQHLYGFYFPVLSPQERQRLKSLVQTMRQ